MSQQYLNTLTWLRAFAAFFVVVSHSIRATEVPYSSLDEASYFFPLTLLDLGTFGVYLFFALSGCTLYISNHNKVDNISDFIPFFVKRFFRIWPAFAISLFVYIMFIEVFQNFYDSDKSFWIAQFLREYGWQDVLSYLSLTFNITGPKGLFIGPYWSLPVEFQYYLLLPFLLLLMKFKYLAFVSPILFGGLLYLLYREQYFEIDRTEVFKMGFVFFGGVLLAKYYKYFSFKVSFLKATFIFMLLVIFAGTIRTGVVVVPEYIPFISDRWNLYGIISLISVALALISDPPKNNSRLLDFIHSYGTISYSIYLYHMLVLGVAILLVIRFKIFGDSQKQFFVLGFTLLFSYLLSKVTYAYTEKKFIKVGHLLSKKI